MTGPELVVPAILRALGLKEQRGRARPLEQLARSLADRELLLVLDNAEHVLGAAPAVVRLLAAAPGLTVLATSRAPFRISGEQELPVRPLELPAAGLVEPRSLMRYPAVALFVERARAASPEFALTEANAPAVAAICARVDGLPLAIELAAARAKFLPPQALLARLGTAALDLLAGGPADLEARQRTLRSTIEWSHGLLAAREQRLLARMSVFVGGATLEAAESLGRALEGGDDVLADLITLIDRSLLQRTETAAGDVRVGMLETIREFALEQLAARGEEEEARRVHASIVHGLVVLAEEGLRTPDEKVWLDRIEADLGNVRAALRWALDRGQAPESLELSARLGRFWLVHGYLSEGRRWLEEALAATADAPPALRARALAAAGLLAHYQADNDRAVAMLEESRDLFGELGDPAGTMEALTGLATVVGRTGSPAAARAMYKEALAIARAAGDRVEVARLLERLGTIVWYAGDHVGATPLLEESLAHARELGLRHEQAAAVQALGWVALSAGDDRGAAVLLGEARSQLRELGDRWTPPRPGSASASRRSRAAGWRRRAGTSSTRWS